MKAAIDNNIFFDEDCFELEIESPQRSVIHRSAAGLDGQVSIDLGLRRRKLIQKGELVARNRAELQKKIDDVNEIIDGESHILKNTDGRVFENLLIEEFKTGKLINGGAHTSCQYQITYSQQG